MQLSDISKKLHITNSIAILRQYGLFITALLVLLFVGVGGFYQLTTKLFYCGTNAAMTDFFTGQVLLVGVKLSW